MLCTNVASAKATRPGAASMCRNNQRPRRARATIAPSRRRERARRAEELGLNFAASSALAPFVLDALGRSASMFDDISLKRRQSPLVARARAMRCEMRRA